MPSSGAARLYEVLDALIALRLEYAEGAEGEDALAVLGPAKVAELRTALDCAIADLKRILGEVPRRLPPVD